MNGSYDREHIAQVFDTYGDQEWNRHEASPMARVSLHLHLQYLQQFVRQGDQVLEVGAGAGRFTVELAKLGA
jgi:2-polyprenyl-3-methyl-5-hydroxy-6-metoxy-1,4-benzoquinol methylase